MQLTIRAKLQPTKEQRHSLEITANEYIRLVNQVAADCVYAGTWLKHTSRTVEGLLPSALKNQAIQDSRSVFNKFRKTKVHSLLRKPMCIWNNQNWRLKENSISFPVWVDGKSKRLEIPIHLSPYQAERLKGKLGTLRITKKSGKWIAQIAVEIDESEPPGTHVMGIDLGLKVPAVAVTDEGKTRFFGNGRQSKFIKRKFRSTRRRLGKLKKLTVVRRLHDKEQRWMKDQDHKISRQLVNFAVQQRVGIIRLEQLSGIRQTARTSRKNEKNLHSWSFYRLAQFIVYKAQLMGIRVEFVDPKYTSQICPECGGKKKVKGRQYDCNCGFQTHRDRLGAMNIIQAPVIGGHSLSA